MFLPGAEKGNPTLKVYDDCEWEIYTTAAIKQIRLSSKLKTK
jgi:hypothetical protein